MVFGAQAVSLLEVQEVFFSHFHSACFDLFFAALTLPVKPITVASRSRLPISVSFINFIKTLPNLTNRPAYAARLGSTTA